MTDKQIDNRILFKARGDKQSRVDGASADNKTLVTIERYSLSHCDRIRQSYITFVIPFLDARPFLDQ